MAFFLRLMHNQLRTCLPVRANFDRVFLECIGMQFSSHVIRSWIWSIIWVPFYITSRGKTMKKNFADKIDKEKRLSMSWKFWIGVDLCTPWIGLELSLRTCRWSRGLLWFVPISSRCLLLSLRWDSYVGFTRYNLTPWVSRCASVPGCGIISIIITWWAERSLRGSSEYGWIFPWQILTCSCSTGL